MYLKLVKCWLNLVVRLFVNRRDRTIHSVVVCFTCSEVSYPTQSYYAMIVLLETCFVQKVLWGQEERHLHLKPDSQNILHFLHLHHLQGLRPLLQVFSGTMLPESISGFLHKIFLKFDDYQRHSLIRKTCKGVARCYFDLLTTSFPELNHLHCPLVWLSRIISEHHWASFIAYDYWPHVCLRGKDSFALRLFKMLQLFSWHASRPADLAVLSLTDHPQYLVKVDWF